ncbi:hypothetical protein ACLQ24_08590 [Micromonospora sp. DT4]|uniref:hypothetical protein n=1 Tax=Micromonospora sp. DT4 TaxID=3393438 RepID=UPI003CE8DB3C
MLLVVEAAAPAAARTPGSVSPAPGGVRAVVRDATTGAPVPRPPQWHRDAAER